MASLTMTLNEKDLHDALRMWLRARGLEMKGTPAINHFPGDMREPATTTINVEVEPQRQPGPPTSVYDR